MLSGMDQNAESASPLVRIRTFGQDDVPRALALNEANVELLAPLDEERLLVLRGLAHRAGVIEVDGAFGGFVLTFAPGSSYDSENYRWFGERYDDFYYLDRIVLEPSVRRRGVGSQVYDEIERVAAPFGRMALEVNLEPPNPGSLAFHAARGYTEVGRLGDPSHRVTLLTKDLHPR